MAELIEKFTDLRKLPPELHIFCPRQNDDDQDRYEEERQIITELEDRKFDVQRHDRIQEAKERRQAYLDCLQLFAYHETHQYKDLLHQIIDEALSKCDLCIREYHQGKQLYLRPKLRDDYDDPEVDAFFEVLDKTDIRRICRGLSEAARLLRDAPPEKRKSRLDGPSLHAMFESLSCSPFLKDDELLAEYFDEPFKLVQTKRPLRTNAYTLAATRFLFDSNPIRLRWATSEWSKLEKPPTESEFDWTIKDFISQKLQEAQSQPTSLNVQRLWRAMQLILNKLERQQITHNLRALDVDICRLALEHFSINSPGLQYLLQSFTKMLEVVPEDFWDAMGSVRPSTVVEQICNNPRFEFLLNDVRRDQPMETTGIGVALAWVIPFVESINPANHPVVCRTLTDQFFKRIKKHDLQDVAKVQCFQAVMEVLSKVLDNFVSNDALRISTARGVLTEVIDIVTDYASAILEPVQFSVYPEELEHARTTALKVIRLTLALETCNVKNDFETLSQNKRLLHGATSYSKSLWDTVINALNQEDTSLSTAALEGVYPLPGLEELPVKEDSDIVSATRSFNSVLRKFIQIFAAMLERLGEFKSDHLFELFKDNNASMILISGLSFPEDNVYQAASELIKNATEEPGRREAMFHLLRTDFFATTLSALSYSYRRLATLRTFSGVPRMVKTALDVLEILTDSQNGLIRTKKYNRTERVVIQKYWRYQWAELRVVFMRAERWFSHLSDKVLMGLFCRDVMQYAEALFEQYSVFANAVLGDDPDMSSPLARQMLDATESSPAAVIEYMVKWLRLRDEYLVTTLVKLLSKLLRRLGDQSVEVNQEAIAYVEDAAITGLVRTNLTQQQKAELVRTLEAYKKKPYSPPPSNSKKQKSLKDFAWTGTAAGKTAASKEASSDDYGDSDLADDDLVEITKSFETKTTRPASIVKSAASRESVRAQPLKVMRPVMKSRPVEPLVAQAGRHDLLAQRQKQRELMKKRSTEAAARLKGKSGIGIQTVGQGSGLQDIAGVEGKDHNSSGPNSMMVSSESESDSEDDIDRELFGSFKTSKKPSTAAFPTVKKQVSGPIKKIKQLRSAKDMRARLAPDLSSLHRTILSWDFFAEGDLPPTADQNGYSLVSNTFRSALEYQKTFEPLLILESWQSFRSAREESNFKAFALKVANRLSVDSFVEISTAMSLQESKDLQLRESDVILLSTSKQPWADRSQPHCLARIMSSGIKKGQRELVFRITSANSLAGLLSPGTELWGASVLSLTPLEREYGGLSALQYYDLCDEILRAKPSPLLDYGLATLQPIIDNYAVNTAQAKAIKSALDNDAFTLIQGPPGSGKTKTICALVGAIMPTATTQGNGSKTQGQNTGRTQVQGIPTNKKVLVCAPSNAAVDELVMRFKAGVRTMNGTEEKINVVRLGRSDAINTAVKDVTIDELVSAKLNATAPRDPNTKDLGEIMQQHKEASAKVIELRNRIDSTRAKGEAVNPADTTEFEGWKRKKVLLGTQIDSERDKKNAMARDLELNRRRIQQEIIDGAHVICATLSGSGHEMFQNLNIEFDTVIIDEAAQSVELSALIPLKYGCSKCILVGDPRQLPPTVLSKAASKYAYEQSLFARMEKNHPRDVHLLDTQYRMHPEISAFPSKEFYESKLKDGANMTQLRAKPWHHSSVFAPYRFFDVQGMHQSAPKGHSLVNVAELQVAMQLYERLITDCSQYNFKGKIGIITPYKGQMKELKLRFSQRYGEGIFSTIEFNTTDAFQGRECEIIIFSCVRASTTSIGFLDDVRRMNVGLTRAKSSLWVLGNSKALMIGEYWRKLVSDARERSLYTDGDILGMLHRPVLTIDMTRLDVEMTDVNSVSSTSPKSSVKPSPVTSKAPSPTANQASPVTSKPPTPSSMQAPVSSRPSSRPSLPSRPASAHSMGSASSGPPTPNFEAPRRMGANGPSGGGNGLNDLSVCGICGSYEHYTHNCDNYDARLAAKGLCGRCQAASHSARDCKEIRCLECGAFGHDSQGCTMRNVLGRQDKERISRQEASHKRQQQRALERARQRQLGEHDAKVPVVRSTAGPSVPNAPKGPSRDGRKPPRGSKASSLSRPGDTPAPIPPRVKSTSSTNGSPSIIATSPSVASPSDVRTAAVKRKRSPDSSSSALDGRNPKASRPPLNGASSRPLPTIEPGASSNPRPAGQPPRPPPGPGGPTAPGSKGVIKRRRPQESDLFMMPKKR